MVKFTRTDLSIQGAFLLMPFQNMDHRGSFAEAWNKRDFDHINGSPVDFVQDNAIMSKKGVLRGLHIQKGMKQYKLVSCCKGKVLDILVDCRPDSPSFRGNALITLSPYNRSTVCVPPGVAHGILSLDDYSQACYKTNTYHGEHTEFVLNWSDPSLGLDLSSIFKQTPIMSEKDQNGLSFNELMEVL
jgi:dTDP-4-dehydrorhamnose 3,5-epimerase